MKVQSPSAEPVPFDLKIMADPYPTYAKLRAAAPVHRVRLPTGAAVWLVTRYQDARSALNDPRLSLDKRHSDGAWPGLGLPSVLQRNLLNMDAPDHTRIRRLVSKVFTARRVESMRPAIERIAEQLADVIAELTHTDLIETFAKRLPARVFGDLLGMPPEFHEDFRAWNHAMLDAETTDREVLKETVANLIGLIYELVAHKRAQPGEDLLSALITVRDDEDRLTEDELLSLTFLLILAGYESTVNMIGLGMTALLDHPQHTRTLRDNPSLFPAAVNELMRYTGAAQLAIRRFTTQPVDIGGVTIPARQTVMVVLPSADRDPSRFPDPDVLNLNRPDAHMNLAFGHGIHHCLGAQLARLEIEIALRTLTRRFPNLRLAVGADQLRWREMFRGRGLVALPVILQPE